MPRNVEIKARVRDVEAVRTRVEGLTATPPSILDQEDVFFRSPRGRVKLRSFPDGRGELIAYSRSNDAGPTLSQYRIHETENPAGLRSFLADVLGVRGTVRKRRHLYRIGQTRVHLDAVEGLGTFLELEVVLTDGQTEESGAAIVDEILADLEIPPEDLIDRAYIDLVEETTE